MREIYNTFSFLLVELSIEEKLKSSAAHFVQKYSSDVSIGSAEEIVHLKHVYSSNYESNVSPLDLLPKLKVYKLETTFPSVMITLVLFCTLPE